MDIDYAAGRIAYKSADNIIAFITQYSLKLEWLIETHVHADHLSGAPYIQGKLGGKIGIGDELRSCRSCWQGLQRRYRIPARRQPV